MGCFPSRLRRNLNNNDGDSFIDLDEEDTPLLNEISRTQQTGHIIPQRQVRDQELIEQEDTELETTLLKLEHARGWREKIQKVETQTELETYRLKIVGLLNSATMEMSRLTKENRHYDVEKVVNSITHLRNAIGDHFFEASGINAFGREVTDMESCVITGGQYFKPVMIHDDDDSIVKLYFFTVSDVDSTEVLFRYYLEHVSFLEDSFALGLVTPDGHTQVEIYGSMCPSYWTIRRDVINNVTLRLNRLEDSYAFDCLSDYDTPLPMR